MPYSALRIGRTSIRGQVYLVTAVTVNRRNWFADLYIGRAIIEVLRISDRECATRTLAFVIMPDHLHWLFELQNKQSLAEVLKKFKGRSAWALNQRLGRTGRVWQPSFHDHGVRSDESLIDIARYVIMNPVRAGLVERVGDYSLWDAVWL